MFLQYNVLSKNTFRKIDGKISILDITSDDFFYLFLYEESYFDFFKLLQKRPVYNKNMYKTSYLG